MKLWLIATLLLIAGISPLDAQTAWASGQLPRLQMKARLILEPDKVEELVGDRLDEEFALVELEVTPLYGEDMVLERHHFRLRCRADNDSSDAQSPERIAGSAVLALESQSKGGGGLFAQSPGTVIGGMPGTGSRPRRMGNGAPVVGSGGMKEAETTLYREQLEETDLVTRLAQRELPLTGDDVANGYLYFQVDPKRKIKHYVFYYEGDYGDLKLQFEKP